ncbi:MAG: HNH endonuclease [Roseburia sp.]|nr:HNH endonuclease [Roseburia sp.]
MALDPIHAFYCRQDYLTLAQSCKVKSGGICARCGGVFDIDELRPHHKIELTLDNIDDVNITLNPANIEVLCHACHNAAHARFGNAVGAKRVYLVYGAPQAGKLTYVQSVATRNDIVVDLDSIHGAICVCGQYDKPDATKRVAFNIRDYLLDEIRTATPRRRWQDAYIIGTYPDRIDRDRIVREYPDGVITLVHIDTSKAECIKRAYQNIKHAATRDAVIGWIENYFARFTA